VPGTESGSRHNKRGRDQYLGRAVRHARRSPAHPQRQRARVYRSDPTSLGSKRWALARCTSSRGALGRTATPRASTGGCAMSSWRRIYSRASEMPGPSQPLGETNTTPSGLTARWVTRPRPGSPPRVRLSPRPRLRLKLHTRPVVGPSGIFVGSSVGENAAFPRKQVACSTRSSTSRFLA
jgi:hypothetical protein